MQDDNWDPYEDDDWDGVPNAYATERYKPMGRSTNILISLAMFGPIIIERAYSGQLIHSLPRLLLLSGLATRCTTADRQRRGRTALGSGV